MIGMGYRTIKTAVGAGLAMWIAIMLQLEFATFAAIIVIMCIETTKKKTLYTIKDKLFATILSLILGMVAFELLGYHPIVFALFILLFMPILVKTRIQSGFITSMVVLLHIYTVQEASLDIFFNELAIITIGFAIALLVNSIMPNFKKDIETLKFQIEEKYSTILFEFHTYLKDKNRMWNGQEIIEAENIINQAKSTIIQDIENHLLREENKDYHYFKMRADQLEILKRMITIVSIVSTSELHVRQKEMLADFFLNISQNVRSNNVNIALEKLSAYEESIRETELPKSREEFEVRANLFYLNFEIKNYLTIKKQILDQLNLG